MTAQRFWKVLAEHGSDPAALARKVNETFRDASADEIAISFDVALRAGALDQATAGVLLENLVTAEPMALGPDLADLDATLASLRTSVVAASQADISGIVSAATELKVRLDARRHDLATIEQETESLRTRLNAIRALAAEVGP